MKQNHILKWIILCFLYSYQSFAQQKEIAHWEFTTAQSKVDPGQEIELVFTAHIQKHWYLYSSDFISDVGPMPTEIAFAADSSFELIGDLMPVAPKKKTDRTWGITVSYFEKTAQFKQRIRVLKNESNIKGNIRGQLCSDTKGQCIPFEKSFQFN